jgi:hypothetical protein
MQKGQETYTDNDILLTHEVYDQLVSQNRGLRAENLYLKQELAQLKRMIFGSKSERHIGSDPGQLNLGLDTETVEQSEKETEQITYTRNKSDNKKGSAIQLALPSHLHREEHIIEPEEDITGARKIGEVATEVLEYTPGKFCIERYVRQKYVLPKEEKIIIGEFPSLTIPRCNAQEQVFCRIFLSASLLIIFLFTGRYSSLRDRILTLQNQQSADGLQHLAVYLNHFMKS